VGVEEYWGVMGFAGEPAKDGEERMEEVGDSENWIEAIVDQQMTLCCATVCKWSNNSLWTAAGGGNFYELQKKDGREIDGNMILGFL